MIAVPGLAPGRTSALVEQVDLFPTLIEAATMHAAGGATVVPHCPADTQASRATALCTEGFSLVPLLKSPVAPWPKAAFSQVRCKNAFLAAFCTKDDLTKTGSGQASGKLKNGAFSYSSSAALPAATARLLIRRGMLAAHVMYRSRTTSWATQSASTSIDIQCGRR
jgi:hypothetical protein